MIVEQLFRAPSDTMATGQPTNPVTVSSISHSFTEVEENVIYYTSGCAIKKLLHQYKKHSGETTEDQVKAVLSLLGDNQDSIKSSDTYLDYVKVWTTTTDHGGFKHISDDTFRFLKHWK